jgi:hypothetical protein
MLDLEELGALRSDTNEQDLALRRTVIVGNALQAVETLAEKNPNADVAAVIASLEHLAAADEEKLELLRLPPRVRSDARRTLELLRADGVGSRGRSAN